MPESFEHLPIVREIPPAPRRRQPNRGGGNYPDRGNRQSFAQDLRTAADGLIASRLNQPQRVGINPHLVFKVPVHEGARLDDVVEALNRYGLTVVSAEGKGMAVAFHDEVELDEFRRGIDRYEAGPRRQASGELAKTTVADVLQSIDPEGMSLWARDDRITRALAVQIGERGESISTDATYLVDVELWHAGGVAAQNAVDEVRALLAAADEQNGLLDSYVAPGLVLLRLRVSGTVLDSLLELDAVASVELPPEPVFDTSAPLLASTLDFAEPPSPAADGPRVCVLDTGVAGAHPLLSRNLGYAASFLTNDDSPADDNGHGTKVCGQAVFGDVRQCYESGDFSSPVTLFSAKIVGRNGRFDDNKLAISQIEDAIALFSGRPYDCRVFNFSIGLERALFADGNRRQGLLAECLDRLARQYQVLIVVAAGNHQEAVRLETGSAQDADLYPGFLFADSAGVCDPASSSIGLTVGGIAQYDIPDDDGSGRIRVPVALRDAPAPMTRTGPGVNGALKPELVGYTDNCVTVSDAGSIRLARDTALSLLCLSNDPTSSLFLYGGGTSLAAPSVARAAAIAFQHLEDIMDEPVHPNLVRALLASAASAPPASATLCRNEEELSRVVGYGQPVEQEVLGSAPTRVTLVAQEHLPIDHFHVFEIPVTESFKYARGQRVMSVTLAYDPPVRRRRLDYLSVEMDYIVIRGKSLDEVYESCRHTQGDEKLADLAPSIQGSSRMVMHPVSAPRLARVRRGRSTLQKASFVWQRRDSEARDYGDSYWLVVRARGKWPSEADDQSYAIVVTMRASDDRLYAQMRARVRERARTRVR